MSHTTNFSVDQGERLEIFEATGFSIKEAKEKSATLMANSGHCVSLISVVSESY